MSAQQDGDAGEGPKSLVPMFSPQPKEDFKRIGQLVCMLGILCQDPDRATQHSSLEAVGHLYQLLRCQRGEPLRAIAV